MDFQVGELCWGKMKGHPHWPCLIDSIISNNRYKVVFLGDRTCANLNGSQLKLYRENFQTFSSTKKKKQLIDAIQESFEYEGYEQLKQEFQQNSHAQIIQKISNKKVNINQSEKISIITEFKIDQKNNEYRQQQRDQLDTKEKKQKKTNNDNKQYIEYPIIKLMKLDQEECIKILSTHHNQLIQQSDKIVKKIEQTSPQKVTHNIEPLKIENKLQIFLSQKLFQEMMIFYSHQIEQPIYSETLSVLFTSFLNAHIEDQTQIKKIIQMILYGMRNQIIQLESIVDVALSMNLKVYHDFIQMIKIQKNDIESLRIIKNCQSRPITFKYLLF